MEVIEHNGYTMEEKFEIARRHLVDRQLMENGLKPWQAEITDEALRAMIEQTTEPGMRALEREIAKVLRKEAVRVAKAMGPASANPTAEMTDWMKAPWYTPREVMAAIHEVLGPAELDPASPPRPYFVQTKRLYCKVEDGLVQSWRVADAVAMNTMRLRSKGTSR
jgi:hypothetical protein